MKLKVNLKSETTASQCPESSSRVLQLENSGARFSRPRNMIDLVPYQVVERAQCRLGAIPHGDDDLLVGHGGASPAANTPGTEVCAAASTSISPRGASRPCPSASRCSAPGRSARTRPPVRYGARRRWRDPGRGRPFDLLAVAGDLGGLCLAMHRDVGQAAQLVLQHRVGAQLARRTRAA